MKESKLKSSLFFVLLAILFLPLLQAKFEWFKESKLNGAISTVDRVYWNKRDWFKGNYQEGMAEYAKHNLGLRNSMIRLNNQIAYSVFDYGKANGVIVGKENYLYEIGYINAYLGLDYVGLQEINILGSKIGEVKDTLDKLGTKLVFVLAPGKASLLPDFLPDGYMKKKRPIDSTNHFQIIKWLEKREVPFIDAKTWFKQLKQATEIPIYAKTGTHLSKYAELILADSIADYLGELFNRELADIQINGIRKSKYPMDTDDDIENGMNLIFDIPDNEMWYADFQIEKDSNTFKPKTVVIGDSYYWGFANYGFNQELFSEEQFWYYNVEVYKAGYLIENGKEINVKEEIEKQDLLMIFITTSHISRGGFGIIDRLYEAFYQPEVYRKYQLEIDLKKVFKLMRTNEEWMNALEQKSIKENIPLDSVMHRDAKYYLENSN